MEPKLEIKDISFVHNALPDLSIEEISLATELIGSSVTVEFPILVLASDESDIPKLASYGTPIAIIVKSGDSLHVYIDSKKTCELPGNTPMVHIEDGIEAAKAVRLGYIPFIRPEQLDQLQLYLKQLRITMFLTDSKDMRALKAAPIYKMG
ncbi:MAG: hypothetical protein ACP5MZ_04650 [Candidatus Micrarchaeia archaeon]